MPTIDFNRRFHPLTAHPFDTEDCREVLPCAVLRPYVRCFWGPVARKYGLVVPDACADIIMVADEHDFRMSFCPVDNTPFYSHSVMDNMFAVRFYFWALPYFQVGHAFDEESFPDLRAYLQREGFLEADFARRQGMMERYLLHRLDKASINGALLDGMNLLLQNSGRASMQDVAMHMAVSPRTMERLFRKHTGLSPKEAAEVIRYQILWRRCLEQPRINLLEQVDALGFYDESHLHNTFRRFHTLPVKEAVRRAKDVAFLQDSQSCL